MKEVYRNQSAELTTSAQRPYSKAGVLFMPEGQEGASPNQEPRTRRKAPGQPVNPEQARAAWERSYRNQGIDPSTISLEERNLIDEAVRRGYTPIEGGATSLARTYTEPRFQAIVDQINDEAVRIDPTLSNPNIQIDSKLLMRQLERVENLIDQGVNASEGRRLIDEIRGEVTKIVKKETEERMRGQEPAQFSLSGLDKEVLATLSGDMILDWSNAQLDIIYDLQESSGNIFDTGQVEGVQRKFGEAIQYLSNEKSKAISENKLDTAEQIAQVLQQLTKEHNTTFNALIMQVSVENGNWEGLQGAAGRLRAAGAFSVLGHNEGKVGALYRDLSDTLRDLRIWEGGTAKHVDTEMVKRLEPMILSRHLALAKKRGVGLFSDEWFLKKSNGLSDEEAEYLIKADIRRELKRANAIFIALQGQANIVAEGRHLDGPRRWEGDPNKMYANVLNFIEMNFAKWGEFNPEEDGIFQHIAFEFAKNEWLTPMEKMGNHQSLSREEQIKLGIELIKRQLLGVPDFWSSAWRVQHTVDAMDRIMIYRNLKKHGAAFDRLSAEEKRKLISGKLNPTRVAEDAVILQKIALTGRPANLTELGYYKQLVGEAQAKAKEYALFTRLKANGTELHETHDKEGKIKIWGKLVTYRTDDVLRILSDRIETRHKPLDAEGKVIEGDDVIHPHELKALYDAFSAIDPSIKNYEAFKRKYGSSIRFLREEHDKQNAFESPLDLAHLTNDQRADVDSLLGAGEGTNLQRFFQTMQIHLKERSFGGGRGGRLNITYRNGVEALAKDWHFANLTTYVYSVDDALIDKFEAPPKGFEDILGISQIMATESGTDPLARTVKDLTNAEAAINALVEFSHAGESIEKRVEAAKKFAEAVKAWDGPSGRARGAYYSIGIIGKLALPPEVLDVIFRGKKLPLDIAQTEWERLVGPGAEPLSSEELWNKYKEEWSTILASDVESLTADQEAQLAEMDEAEAAGKKREWQHAARETSEKYKKLLRENWGITWGKRWRLKLEQLILLIFIFASMQGTEAVKDALEDTGAEVGTGGGSRGGH